jgi:hypothetical protein
MVSIGDLWIPPQVYISNRYFDCPAFGGSAACEEEGNYEKK